jgi:hypothetical protein
MHALYTSLGMLTCCAQVDAFFVSNILNALQIFIILYLCLKF